MTYTEAFETDGLADELAFAFALFLTLMALFEAVKSLTATREPAPQTEQHHTLNEDALRRLEDGDTVTVPRWHGNDLEIQGTQIVDVQPVTDDQEANDG
ncbi:MAG: hypothetical protein ABEJ85_04940 [Haloarculaceae archaeon]